MTCLRIPLATAFTPANAADSVIAPRLLRELPLAVRYVLGDRTYNTPGLRTGCALQGRFTGSMIYDYVSSN